MIMKYFPFSPLVLLAALPCLAQATPRMTLQPQTVTAFSNKVAYIELQGTLPEGQSIPLENLPDPSLGSFWIEAEAGATIQRVVSGWNQQEQPQNLNDAELLMANVGAAVEVCYQLGGDEILSAKGTILPFPMVKAEEVSRPLRGTLLLLQTEQGCQSIPIKNIQSVTYFQKPQYPVKRQEKKSHVLELAQPAAGKKVRASCISTGLQWNPSYQLILGEGGKAQLQSKATICNELMDMDRVQLQLATGFPILEDAFRPDPMVLRDMARKMRVLHECEGEDEFFEKPAAAPMVMAGANAPAAGINTGKLFFYPVQDFTAKKGEVVTQSLFEAPLPYEPGYSWKVEDPTDFPEPQDNTLPPSDIWACVTVTNTLAMPLAEAPIEILEQGQIAAQTTLPFTAAGASSRIRLSRAVELQNNQRISLEAREDIELPAAFNNKGNKPVPGIKSTYGVTLQIQNNSAQPATIEVDQFVMGKILEVKDGGEYHTTSSPIAEPLNARNSIRWKVTVPAKENRMLYFRYERRDRSSIRSSKSSMR